MSAVGSGEVLKPILLRSTTPAANEKVLSYLESMNIEGQEVDRSPPSSIAGHSEYRSRGKGPGSDMNGAIRSPKIHSPTPKGSRHSEALHLEDLANSPLSYGDQNGARNDDKVDDEYDADSNFQEGRRSEDGSVHPTHEPGPGDPPGPRYESYDSGPSFGNFGPLPADDHATPGVPHPASNPFANGSGWQPPWTGPNAKPEMPWGLNTSGLTQGGLTPGYPAKVPLPDSVASPRGTSVNIGVESPSSPRSRGFDSQSPSRVSNKAPSAVAEHEQVATGPASHKAHSRTGSKAPTNRGGESDSRPFSPLSAKSRGTTKTRATEKGTVYPALPESAMGEEETVSPSSPRPKRSKAPSVSPSDSPSQAHVPKSPNGEYRSTRSPTEGGGGGAEFSPRSGTRQIPNSPPARSQALGSVMSGGPTHQSRPFSPYRHAATTEDLLHAAVRGRAMAFPENNGKQPSIAPSQHNKELSVISSHHSKEPSLVSNGKQPSRGSPSKAASALSAAKSAASRQTRGSKQPSYREGEERDGSATPTPSRPHTPTELNQEEERIVQDALAGRTPRTSYYAASALEPEVTNSHFHDMDLCILLHQENDPSVHEVVKRALRKAVRQRIKKLGMKYDHESIKQYKKSYHDHDPSVHLRPDYMTEEPPKWASDIKREIVLMQQRIESLGPKIEGLRPPPGRSHGGDSRYELGYDGDEFSRTPMTQTVNIHTQPTGTMADSMYQPETELIVDSQAAGSQNDEQEFDEGTEHHHGFLQTDGETRTRGQSDYMSENRDDSPGQQFLEEELYKLRQKPQGSQSALSHRTWEVARDDDPEDYDEEPGEHGVAASGLPTIPDSNAGGYTDHRSPSPPLPAIPQEGGRDLATTPQQVWHAGDYSTESQQLLPWQRIHQRLLSWAIIWPVSELDTALNSTTRGHQVDEVALSIWSTQTYKRYVRARLTDSPQGVVDRLFVPPNMADAISTAVFNGRHGDACGMLRDLWSPFGLEGMPRLLVVLAKHRSDENHWVVHRFSLPDGALTTYDSYPERTLPDGRPLGWWFAIRVAWPNAIYPSPDHLMQKMVRLHRPMQLPIDNSVAAGGIWRNILMGSRAERSLDLERLRDLINTEVKNLRQRKQLGKLSIGAPRPTWEDMN